jgi:hypothetical protein
MRTLEQAVSERLVVRAFYIFQLSHIFGVSSNECTSIHFSRCNLGKREIFSASHLNICRTYPTLEKMDLIVCWSHGSTSPGHTFEEYWTCQPGSKTRHYFLNRGLLLVVQ